jgi:eukaryotic-like serine/threonine-protein kinase
MFMVQDFIEGADLGKQYLNGRCWSESEIKAMLIDLLEVLDYVHQHQIVHRDIKPENIIQRHEDKRYVLIDFGAVKELNVVEKNSDNAEKNSDNLVVGTAGYRAPEHLRGEPCSSSDIYGLGITAIQLLTRTHPSYLPRVADQLSWQEKALVTPELASVIDRMICPQLVDRYQSAQEVITDLHKLPDTLPINVLHPPTQNTQSISRKSLVCGALCAVIIVGVSGIYLSQQQPKSVIQQKLTNQI